MSWIEQFTFPCNDDAAYFVLDHNAALDFYSASSLKQQSRGRHVSSFNYPGRLSLFRGNRFSL